MQRFNKVVCCSKLLEGVFTFGKQYELHSSKKDPMYNLLSDNGTLLEVSSSYFTDVQNFQKSSNDVMEERDHRILEIGILENEEAFIM